MTAAGGAALGLALGLYLAAAALSHGGALLGCASEAGARWARSLLLAGWTAHAAGLALRLAFSPGPPADALLVVVSALVLGLLAAALVAERWLGARHVPEVAAPLAFVALLHPVLMPVRCEAAAHLLLRCPWLGVHVGASVLGYLGFALAGCSAAAYLVQNRALKRGRLNRYLPALGTAARLTYAFAAAGFWVFTLGLAMGLAWFLGSPGAYLGARDAKIWMSVPVWAVFAIYLFEQRVRGRHGSRLKWLVVAGTLLALANLLSVRHQFRQEESAPRAAQPRRALTR